ncbi:polysaccharide pyruvyl transferase family protein, partial [bacterium]|nr:polysaccharide pyruvyl transferase family protein [bacterium]
MDINISGKKIFLVNGWSDLNKGDSGIVFGMISSFKKTLPDAEISLLSEFSEDDYRFINGYGYLLTFYPRLKVYGSLLPYTPIWRDKPGKPIASKPVRICLRAGYLIRSLIILVSLQLGRLLLSKNEKETLRNFQEADLIVSKGGHIFYSLGGLGSLVGLYHHAYPLLLAIKLRKPFVFYAQSMGPFKGRIAKRFARWLFSKASLITVREELSRDTLVSLKVPARKIDVVPDAAFALDPASGDDAWHMMQDMGISEGEKFVAVTVRQWFFGKDP